MQLKTALDAVANSDEPKLAAAQLLDEKTAKLATLKAKAKDRAENELSILKEELAKFSA